MLISSILLLFKYNLSKFIKVSFFKKSKLFIFASEKANIVIFFKLEFLMKSYLISLLISAVNLKGAI